MSFSEARMKDSFAIRKIIKKVTFLFYPIKTIMYIIHIGLLMSKLMILQSRIILELIIRDVTLINCDKSQNLI